MFQASFLPKWLAHGPPCPRVLRSCPGTGGPSGPSRPSGPSGSPGTAAGTAATELSSGGWGIYITTGPLAMGTSRVKGVRFLRFLGFWLCKMCNCAFFCLSDSIRYPLFCVWSWRRSSLKHCPRRFLS
jgi:hypothetical protein